MVLSFRTLRVSSVAVVSIRKESKPARLALQEL